MPGCAQFMLCIAKKEHTKRKAMEIYQRRSKDIRC